MTGSICDECAKLVEGPRPASWIVIQTHGYHSPRAELCSWGCATAWLAKNQRGFEGHEPPA